MTGVHKPIRIRTQEEAARIRRSLTFCYICGEPLPDENKRTRASTAKEHVIPRALLGKPPPVGAWPVVLDVHKQCERLVKRQRDSWLALYARFDADPLPKIVELKRNWIALTGSQAYRTAVKDPHLGKRMYQTFLEWVTAMTVDFEASCDSWIRHLKMLDLRSEPELHSLRDRCISLIVDVFYGPTQQLKKLHYRSSPLKIELVGPPGEDGPVEALAGLQQLARGVWLWIGGLHALLYREPVRFISIPFCLPPVPVFGATLERSLDVMAQHTVIIRRVLEIAEHSERWDTVCAWGGRLEYRCTWFSVPEMRDCARCYWKLSLPSVHEDRRVSTFPGVSWYGVYELKSAPRNASTVGHEEFNSYNLHLQELGEVNET